MSLRLVRCPFCGKRFNVTGIAAGSRLRCAGCTAVLTVPRPDARPYPVFRFSRGLALQISGGIAAGLVAAVGLFLLLRPSPAPPPSIAVAPKPPAAPRESDRPSGEEHTSELQSRFGISYAVFCLKKTNH